MKRLLEEFPDSVRLVTTTSREPRPDEVDGVDYSFVDPDHFQHMIERGDFIEWEENYGNLYGSERAKLDEALENHPLVFVALDIRGAKTYQKKFPEAATMAIFVPSDQIPSRILGRAPMDSIELEQRVEAIRDEQSEVGIFDFVVENEDGKFEEQTIPHAKDFVADALSAHQHEEKKK